MATPNDEPTRRLQLANLERQAALATMIHSFWNESGEEDIEAAWGAAGKQVVTAVTAFQQGAAYDGAVTVHNQLKADGKSISPLAIINPTAFSGMAPGGGDLARYFQAAVSRGAALPVGERSLSVLNQIIAMALEAVRAPSRWGVSTAITARPEVGYIREVTPPSCKDCALLNGRFYRWNEGFLRHPHCDCIHRPITLEDARYREIMGMDEVPLDQITGLTKAERAALEMGADLSQVVNAARGRYGDSYTTEGTSKRGAYTLLTEYGRAGRERLTPAAIINSAKTREEAIKGLQDYGYMLSGVKGKTYEGYGQFGNKKWAREAVDEARKTGVRNMNNPATMTAAEYRAWKILKEMEGQQ